MAVQTGGRQAALGPERGALLNLLLDHLVWLILLIILVIFSLTIERFFQIGIFLNILQHATFVGLIAIGLSFCIIAGHMDLSVELVMAFAAMLCRLARRRPRLGLRVRDQHLADARARDRLRRRRRPVQRPARDPLPDQRLHRHARDLHLDPRLWPRADRRPLDVRPARRFPHRRDRRSLRPAAARGDPDRRLRAVPRDPDPDPLRPLRLPGRRQRDRGVPGRHPGRARALHRVRHVRRARRDRRLAARRAQQWCDPEPRLRHAVRGVRRGRDRRRVACAAGSGGCPACSRACCS